MIEHRITEIRDLKWWERFFEWVGWHKPGPFVKVNMASADGFERVCARCGQRLIRDSQGGWFPV